MESTQLHKAIEVLKVYSLDPNHAFDVKAKEQADAAISVLESLVETLGRVYANASEAVANHGCDRCIENARLLRSVLFPEFVDPKYIRYTDAPDRYDYAHTKTLEVIGTSRGIGSGPVRKIQIGPEQGASQERNDFLINYQCGRYRSGLYFALTQEQLDEYPEGFLQEAWDAKIRAHQAKQS